MYLQIDLTDQITGIFSASAEELPTDFFLLNISFTIDQMTLDGKTCNYTIETCTEDNYQLIRPDGLHGPQTIEIRYHGILDGTTGLYPYARETTLNDFILLRFETLYYPLSAGIPSDEDFFRHLLQTKMDIHIHAAAPRKVFSNAELLSCTGERYHFQGYSPAVAVGTFYQTEFAAGKIAALQSDPVSVSSISSFIERVFHYMSETYYPVRLKNVNIVIIPEGFGSFAVKKNLFLSRDSLTDERNFIHELIHLGWNPNCELIPPKVQQCRFFDEGLTQYLMAEVYEHFYPHTLDETYRIFHREYQTRVVDWGIPVCPLTEYGRQDAGDLAYGYGPFVFRELEQILTQTGMRTVIRHMIADYQNVPIDFEKFLALLEPYGIRSQAEALLQTTDYQRHLLA